MRTARILSLYVMRETLVYFGLAFAGVTLILLTQNLLVRIDELFVIGLRLGDLMRLGACLLPIALSYSLPLAFLVGIVLAARRLGNDGELLAMRSLGIGPDRYLVPHLLLGLAVTALVAWLVTSREHVARRELVALAKSVAARGAILEPRRFRRLGDQMIFVEDRTPDGVLSGVMIYDARPKANAYRLFAEHGRFRFDDAHSAIEIELWDGDVHLDPGRDAPRRSARIHFDRFRIAVDVSKILGHDLGPVRPKQMSRAELETVLERARRGDPLAELDQKDPVEYALEIERRRTLPFASVLFAGLGVPIVLASEQRGRNLALPIALAAAFAYFALGTVAESIVQHAWLPAGLASWIPNAVFLAAALALTRFVRHRIPR